MTGGDRRGARSRIKSNEDDSIGKIKPNLKLCRGRSRADGSALQILTANLKVVLGFSILAFLIIFFTIQHLMNQAEEVQTARVVTPFPAPKIMDLPQFQGEHKESMYWVLTSRYPAFGLTNWESTRVRLHKGSMYWGIYRPYVYFGIRSRTPRSLIAGLMWIARYGWTQHNGRDFGHQLLVDQDMTLETSFLKSKGDGSGYGGDWAVRIDVQNIVNVLKKNKFTANESNEITSFLEQASVRLEALSSGLDDYPHASQPSEDERHLDLRCWILLAADCMGSIGKLFEMEKTSAEEIIIQGESSSRKYQRPEPKLVPHIGYVSLFPFMESWILGKQLDLISNKSILWTAYGLRSLSKTSTLYMKRNTEHDPPYWRDPIWMNVNYMILSALKHCSLVNGPYRERAKTIYDGLRSNLIRNVVQNYYQNVLCGNNMIRSREREKVLDCLLAGRHLCY
ncbi:hypothetical protein SLEP1_g55567 [Rubroshorea leprosula]|uniref:Mannosyl-oligosaccharide glucosidase n=1 Tax=Rubroshorea leprosula TaxID=152421 RepID=A0AAV5MIA5_9ROSI|nr:hypothetical protein SLEP1_g55567 [Rubroshorea leprosula]